MGVKLQNERIFYKIRNFFLIDRLLWLKYKKRLEKYATAPWRHVH